MIRYSILSLVAATAFAQTTVTPAPKPAAPKAATAKSPGSSTTKKAAAPAAPVIPLPKEPGEYAIFNTTLGRVVVKLYEKEAPITVANFVGLARGTKTFTDEKSGIPVKRPFYNGLTFHRVIPKFMIQGGDPTGTGSGGGGVPTIPDEFVPTLTFDKPGILAMANTGRPHTGGCQFFITTTDSTPSHLNGKHTIFGQVVEGQDVVDAISAVPTAEQDKPVAPVIIKTLLIRRVSPPAPPKPATPATPATPAKKT